MDNLPPLLIFGDFEKNVYSLTLCTGFGLDLHQFPFNVSDILSYVQINISYRYANSVFLVAIFLQSDMRAGGRAPDNPKHPINIAAN